MAKNAATAPPPPPVRRKSALLMNFVTYRNHVLYLSVYIYMVVSSYQNMKKHPYHNNNLPYSLATSDDNDLAVTQQQAQAVQGISFWGSLGFYYGSLAFFLLCLYFELSYVFKRRTLPPGDSGWPLVGHFLEVVHDFHAFHQRRVQQFGSMSTHRVFSDAGVILTDDDDIQWVMAQERKGNTKVVFLPHWTDLLGTESIILQSGNNHKRLRKIFGPAFSPTAIKDYARSMDNVVQNQLEIWSASGRYQPPREWALLAMRVFFVCAFGDANETRMEELARLFEGWIDGFRAVPVRLPGGNLARAHRFKEQMFAIFREMIDEFKATNPPPSSSSNDDDQHEQQQQQHKSVLGRLCYAVDDEGNMPSEQVLMDNLLFFLFAGFDTTKASFCAIFHFLDQHPAALRALNKEIQGLGQEEELLDVDRLKHGAPVLNAVLAETWRLMAPLPSHSLCAAVDLSHKGYTFPEGTYLLMDIHSHNTMNETRYPGASDFRFERWLPKDHPLFVEKWANGEPIDYNVMSNKFRSFNMGQHMCLGGHFAKMEVRIVVARILQRYTVSVRNEKFIKFPVYQIVNEFKLTPSPSPSSASSLNNQNDEKSEQKKGLPNQ